VPAQVAALAGATIKDMCMAQVKLVAAVVLAVGLLGAGVAGLTYRALAAEPPGAPKVVQADADRPQPDARKAQQPGEKKPSGKAEGKPKTAADQYQDLQKEAGQALAKVRVGFLQAKTAKEKE